MYSFKNPVYLIIGIIFVLFGAALSVRSYGLVGVPLLLLGLAMSTFAAYQMGQASRAPER